VLKKSRVSDINSKPAAEVLRTERGFETNLGVYQLGDGAPRLCFRSDRLERIGVNAWYLRGDGEMVRQGQDGLHHVKIVDARRVHLRQRGGEKIGLLLIVALDSHAVAGLDDRFKQLGRRSAGQSFPLAPRIAAARASRAGRSA